MTTTEQRPHDRRGPARTGPHAGAVAALTGGDGAAAGRALAAAFQDDPVFAWFAPDPAARRAHLPRWFTVVAEVIAGHGVSHRAADHTGAALWVPPGAEAMTAGQGEQLGEATEPFGPAAGERSSVLTAAMDANHPPQPHHYLWFLGVAPHRQGQGLGSALLAGYLQELDRAGEKAYLEATSPGNRRLYERHGFEVTGVISAADDAPPLWAMWRDPR